MQMVVSFHGLIMKINSKVIFVAVVVIILIGIFLTLDDSYKIAKVIDGATIELDNGTQVRLIGIDNTEEGRRELKSLEGENIVLQPDMSANFDPHLLKGRETVYAYLLLKNYDYECVNATIIKKGLASLVEGGCLVDSLDAFKSYVPLGQQKQKDNNINPTPIVQVIDYSADSLKLPVYTPQPERRFNSWSSESNQNIEMLQEACDYNLPYTKMFANQLAGRSQGEFSIEQVCEIFDYCYKKWRYVNDPKGQDYIARASETISASLTGDCDDFAVLMASCILACGGDACIVYAEGSNGCHAYPEVDINSFRSHKDISYIQNVISNKFSSYSPGLPNVRESDGHIWLNLDWQAAYPGGPHFGAEHHVYYSIVDGQWNSR